jgi:hypothetical protein
MIKYCIFLYPRIVLVAYCTPRIDNTSEQHTHIAEHTTIFQIVSTSFIGHTLTHW